MGDNKADLLRKILEKSNQKKGGSFQKDPHEWKPPQVKKGDTLKLRAYILYPLNKGDKCQSGIAQIGMDNAYFIRGGDHWVDKRKYPCPRCYDDGACPFCEFGFSLLGEVEEKKAREEIVKTYLPRTFWAVNVYFPAVSENPKEIHDKVFYWPLSKTIFDILDSCINNTDPGSDDDDPKPCGLFCDPEESYPLIITIAQKGDYNDYTKSKLGAKKYPIGSDKKKIEEILARRHDIAAKYSVRDETNLKLLQSLTDRALGKSDSTSEFSAVEKEEKKEVKEEKKPVSIKLPNLSGPSKPSVQSEIPDDDSVVAEAEAEAPPKPKVEAKPKPKPKVEVKPEPKVEAKKEESDGFSESDEGSETEPAESESESEPEPISKSAKVISEEAKKTVEEDDDEDIAAVLAKIKANRK